MTTTDATRSPAVQVRIEAVVHAAWIDKQRVQEAGDPGGLFATFSAELQALIDMVAQEARQEGISYFFGRLKANGHWKPEMWIDWAAMDDPSWLAEAYALLSDEEKR